MANLRPLLASASLALAALAPAQAFTHFLYAQVSLLTYNEGEGGDVFDYHSLQLIDGPASVDYKNSHERNGSVFTGRGTVESDYGTIRLFARTEVSNPMDGASTQITDSLGSFFDELTITGGTAGATLRASMTLDGLYATSDYQGASVGALLSLGFFVYSPETDGWDYAHAVNDVHTTLENGAVLATQTATLANYDPTRRYALMGQASVSVNVNRGYESEPDEIVSGEVDATQTARLTGIGFTTGPLGSFVGASGHVYPSAVPEPASLLALGAGLAFLRRRRA